MPATTEELSLEEEFIRKLDEAIQKNLSDEHFGVEELSRGLGISRSALLRRLKKITHKSVNQYIREIRLQLAMEMLHKNVAPVSEIAYRVGFSSPAYFNTCFHEYYGFPPGEVKKREPNSHQSEKESVGKSLSESVLKNKKIHPHRRFLVLLSGLGVLLVIAIIIYTYFLKNTPYAVTMGLKNREKSIAVLPFVNLSKDIENQYFADGVMEDILTNLSYIRELKVISRTSTEQFRQTTKTSPEIAGILGVNYVLEGSVQRYSDKVRVRIQFIDAKNDRHLFSEIFDRDLQDIFIIQSDIAIKVAGELQATLSTKESEKIDKAPTQNKEAYNLYLMGRFLESRWYQPEMQLKSVEYYKQALLKDPDFALAYAGLASVHSDMGYFIRNIQSQDYEKAREYALKALELDKNLAEAHVTLGTVFCFYDWKWEEARKEYLKAIEINPNYAHAYGELAQLLYILRDRKGARTAIEQALELDPLSYGSNNFNGVCYLDEGKLEEALQAFSRALEILPERNDLYWQIALVYLRQGKETEVVEAFKKLYAGPQYKEKLKDLDGIYQRNGIKGVLKWSVETEMLKQKPNRIFIAARYVLLGEKEEALNWLDKDPIKSGRSSITKINSNTCFDEIRSEPRFKVLIEKMGLTPYNK
jgi:TolB-like protein/AraC-like DNA-binding protein/Tfp pilus assembly protein PilF